MSALADKIPELRQLAYSMYQDEGNEMRANLEMLMALEQGDYAKYTDLLGQWNTDRNFDYGVHRDQISDNRYNNEWNYQVGRDDIADKRYEDETAWERSQYTSEKEYNQALAKAQTLAAAGDFSGYKALGYTDAEIKNLKTAYDKAQRASVSGTRKGSSSSSGGGNKGGTGNKDVYAGMYDAGIRSEGDAYAWLLTAGYNTTQAGKLADYYAEWMKNKGDSDGTEDYTIENRHGDSWIYIPGHGRFSYQEVYNYVESGKIKETINKDGTIRYTWADNKK